MVLADFFMLSSFKAGVCVTFALYLVTPQSFSTETSYQQGELRLEAEAASKL